MEYLRNAASAIFNAVGVPGFTSVNEHEAPARQPKAADNLSDEPFRIAWLLQQKLPGDLVPIVLDFARVWHVAAVAQSLRPDRVGELQAPKLQTALIVPHYVPRGAVRRIRFIVNSRDQGWSDYTQDHGTYRGSWTWFEAGVRGLDVDDHDDRTTLFTPVDCQHRNALDDEHKRLCMANQANYKYGSRRIVTNIHAGKEFRTHVVEWDADHEDEDVRRMAKELIGGCRVEVSAHAKFPGWVNYVQSVAVEIECATVRRV